MIIAEIGLNHMGNEQLAKTMLKKLVETAVDAVTFQIAKPEFYDGSAPWRKPLSKPFYQEAIMLAHQKRKPLGFAIADPEIARFLDAGGADFWKTLSTDVRNTTLQHALTRTGKPLFISTGLSDEKEVVEVSKGIDRTGIKFIHTQLSHNVEDANLGAIKRLRDVTGIEVAFGMHCSDINVLYLSSAFSPSDIFFYVKGDAEEEYPDNEHAVKISDVESVVSELKSLGLSIGSGIKENFGDRLE